MRDDNPFRRFCDTIVTRFVHVSGRLSRREFLSNWAVTANAMVGACVLSCCCVSAFAGERLACFVSAIVVGLSFFLVLPFISLSIRRLHDIGRSAVPLELCILGGLTVEMVVMSIASCGSQYANYASFVSVCGHVALLGWYVSLMCRHGDDERNVYGMPLTETIQKRLERKMKPIDSGILFAIYFPLAVVCFAYLVLAYRRHSLPFAPGGFSLAVIVFGFFLLVLLNVCPMKGRVRHVVLMAVGIGLACLIRVVNDRIALGSSFDLTASVGSLSARFALAVAILWIASTVVYSIATLWSVGKLPDLDAFVGDGADRTNSGRRAVLILVWCSILTLLVCEGVTSVRLAFG